MVERRHHVIPTDHHKWPVGVEPDAGLKRRQRLVWPAEEHHGGTQHVVSARQVWRHRQRSLSFDEGPLSIAAAEQPKRQAGAGLGVGAVERNCTADEWLSRDLHLLQSADLKLRRGGQPSPSKSAVSAGKIRIEIDRLLKEFFGERIIRSGQIAEMPQAALVGGPRVEVAGGLAHSALALGIG